MTIQIINDTQLFEGFMGGIGSILAVLVFKSSVNPSFKNTNIVFIISWCIIWWFRKITMNLYSSYKKINNIEDKHITIASSSSLLMKYIILSVIVLVLTILYSTNNLNM